MPTYDYRCNACGHTFELFQSMNDSVKRKCPECAKNKLERLIGMGAGILFKGGGFYQTDYRSDAYKKDAKADKAPEKASEKSSEKAPKTEAKPQKQSKSPKSKPKKD